MIKQCSIHGLLTSMLLIVFSLMSNDAIAQKAIRGTVLDEANEPIIGASVLVKGTTNGSITGVDGTFNVKANPSDVLVISYVGYATVEQQVGNQTQLVIHLREDSKVLNDVVVIGYGSTTKKELTGSVTSMKKDDLNPGTFTNAMGMLQGKVAGLQIINPNGADPTAKYEVLLRGTNTLSAGQGPLIIIDGVAGADIRNINFQEVESIDVLKDGSAAAIYGTRGTNGVIIVTTKRARSGKTEVSYDGQLTVGVVSRRAKPLSASEYKSVIKEYRPELESYIFDSDTDWFKEITQTPFSHKHNLSISGGSEKFSHHTSFNYEKSDGLQKHNSSEKLMARTNIRQSLLDKWVDLDYNLNIIHRKYSPSSTSAFMQAFTHNPTEPVYDDSDPDAGGYSRIKAMEYYNPVAIINERNMESKNDNYGANIRATLNILPIKGLKWENFVSYDKFSHHTSFNYEKSDGLQKHNSSEKLMARTNIRQSLLDKWVDLDYNLNIIHRKYSPSSTSAFMQAFTHNPTEPVYDDSDPDAGGYSRIKAMEYYNPVAIINERNMESKNDNYGANIRATLNILPIKGLKWENFVSYDKEQYETREYYTHYYPSLIGTNGQAYIENYQENDTQYESTLNYSNIFGKHSIQALLGYTYQYTYSTSASMTNSGFDFDDNQTHNIGTGTNLTEGKASMSSNKEDNTYIGFFGRFMYNYDDKYLLSASLRRDGSSRFGDNNKWGWFPAVSVGWRINKEKFLSNVKWIDDLKLRAGYGVTGNQDFSNYKSLMMMTTAGKFYYNGQWINTYQPASNANPDLKWEKKAEFNVGVDMTMFDNRLSFTFDYYKRTTSNLLYDYIVPTPPYVYNTLFTNVGKVTNEGVELTISGTPFNTRDFTWNTSLTVSHNKNKLVKFTNDEFTNGTYKVGWSTSAACYTQRLIEGQSLGTFYGPIWLGTDTDGKDVLLGQNADGSVPEEQWEKIGCAYPDATLSWSNTFRYKKFDLSFSLRASIGGEILNNYAMEYENLSSIGLRNISSNWLSQTNFTSTTYKYSSKYIEDASYLKLDNVTFGYTWDFTSKMIKRLRLSLTAQNVFCITGYSGVDPEVALSGLEPGMESLSYYPRTTEFTFGVNIVF